MSNQLQCPNCGGYKLESNLTEIDPKTGNKVGSSCFPLFFGVVILPVFFIGSWLVVGYQGENAYIIVLVSVDENLTAKAGLAQPNSRF